MMGNIRPIEKDEISRRLGDAVIGRSLIVMEEASSTNTLLCALAREGVPHGTAMIAASQTSGRGRMGRSFLSPEGGVYMSVLLRELPGQTGADNAIITSLAAVAFRQALQGFCEEYIGIKWVNDLQVGGKKLAGILAQGVMSCDGQLEGVVIGIGVNIGEVPQGVADIACALSEQGEYMRERVAAAMLCALEDTLRRSVTEVMDDYRAHSVVVGRDVTILAQEGDIAARAIGIDDRAHLICETASGERRVLDSGEIRIRL